MKVKGFVTEMVKTVSHRLGTATVAFLVGMGVATGPAQTVGAGVAALLVIAVEYYFERKNPPKPAMASK